MGVGDMSFHFLSKVKVILYDALKIHICYFQNEFSVFEGSISKKFVGQSILYVKRLEII